MKCDGVQNVENHGVKEPLLENLENGDNPKLCSYVVTVAAGLAHTFLINGTYAQWRDQNKSYEKNEHKFMQLAYVSAESSWQIIDGRSNRVLAKTASGKFACPASSKQWLLQDDAGAFVPGEVAIVRSTHEEVPLTPDEIRGIAFRFFIFGTVVAAGCCLLTMSGLKGSPLAANMLMCCYMLFSMVTQMQYGKRLGNFQKYRCKIPPIMGFIPHPLSLIGAEQWHALALTNLPNYGQTISGATATGRFWLKWSQEDARVFAERWAYAPIVGKTIGEVGIPSLLIFLMILQCLCKLILMFRHKEEVVHTDAADMTFLSAIVRGPHVFIKKVKWVGAYLVFLVQFPMLWLKIALLSMVYDTARMADKLQLVLAIALAVYSIGPITLPVFYRCTEKREDWKEWWILGIGYICFLILCGLHFFGIWYCRDHDLTLFNGCSRLH